jgi:hypothetical protein
MLTVFRDRHNPTAREAYLKSVTAEAAERNATTPRGAGKKAGKKKSRVEDL